MASNQSTKMGGQNEQITNRDGLKAGEDMTKKEERIIISIGVGETNDEVRFFIDKFVTSDSTTVGCLVGLIHYPLLFHLPLLSG